MATQDRPTREEIESWDEEATLSVYTDLGLRGGRTHGGRKRLIFNYFGLRHLKREAEGECATPGTAHVGGSRRIGETPEAVRLLPMPGAQAPTVGAGDNGGEQLEIGGDRVQRRFTESMDQVMDQAEMAGHHETQEEDRSQDEGRGQVDQIWTAPALVQVQISGNHSGAGMAPQGPPASTAPNQPPSLPRPKRRMPPLSNRSRTQLTQLDARPDEAAIKQLTDAGLRALLVANGLPRARADRREDFARYLITYLAEDA